MSFQANWCIFAGLDALGDLGWCHTLRMEADAFCMPSLHVFFFERERRVHNDP